MITEVLYMAVIYKLTREDNLEYIGITNELRKRISSHKRSKRFFELKIINTTILFEGSYDECDSLEESYICLYDTFRNGLNMTCRGKGKNETSKFNTLGYKFSEASRLKMSISGKNRKNRLTGYKHNDSTKNKWRELRKGKIWGPVKVDKSIVLKEWYDFAPSLSDMEYLISKTNNKNGEQHFNNGRKFTYLAGKLVLFKHIKSVEYNVTKEAIKRIITNESLL
jgi:GIY-YIG catalytic domain